MRWSPQLRRLRCHPRIKWRRLIRASPVPAGPDLAARERPTAIVQGGAVHPLRGGPRAIIAMGAVEETRRMPGVRVPADRAQELHLVRGGDSRLSRLLRRALVQ